MNEREPARTREGTVRAFLMPKDSCGRKYRKLRASMGTGTRLPEVGCPVVLSHGRGAFYLISRAFEARPADHFGTPAIPPLRTGAPMEI